MPTDKPYLQIHLDAKNREAVRTLRYRLNYNSISEMGRAILSQLCEENGIQWDYELDPITQWGEHNRPKADTP